MLVLNVLAAFCAAENTDEKNPPCGFVPGLVAGFSGVGVKGAEVMLDNLLGPRVADPDRIRRCDIILPEGEVTTFEPAAATGEDVIISCAPAEDPVSVGVGGVFTITGAVFSPAGGVWGRKLVSIGLGTLAVRGRSGVVMLEGRIVSLLGNMAPILDATLPRLPAWPPAFPSFWTASPLFPPFGLFRSGLKLGPRRGLNASRNFPTGEDDPFEDPLPGLCKESVLKVDDGRKAAVLLL
jgi:hypothetical protein